MGRAFAKPAFDVGFATNAIAEYTAFWGGQVGLTYDHLAKLGGGFHQHRWRQGDSIVKVNHTQTPLPDAVPGGYRRLTLASDKTAELLTPDGAPVTLKPDPATDLTLHVVANTWIVEDRKEVRSQVLGGSRWLAFVARLRCGLGLQPEIACASRQCHKGRPAPPT